MKIQFTIPDEIFEHYVKKYGLPRTYQVMRRAVEVMKDVDDNDRYVFIAGDDRRVLEALFQTTIDDAKKLIRLTKNLNVVKIAGVNMDLTADEIARIDMQATFHGRTREAFLVEMVTELKNMMLEKC